MPSLTETAKKILMKESDDPTPDRGAKSMTPNMQTLSPGSRNPEGIFGNPDSSTPLSSDVEDLGPALVDPNGMSGPAMASMKMGQAKYPGTKPPVPAEQPQQQAAVMEEEFEISEELQDFINEMIEEGYSEEEIAEAIEENFELVEEKEDEKKEEKDIDRAARAARAEFARDQIQKGKDERRRLRKSLRMKEHVDALLAGAIEENFELISEEDDEIPFGTPVIHTETGNEYTAISSKGDKVIVASGRTRRKIDRRKLKLKDKMMKEHVDALLAGENLSEEFRAKAETIFESAVAVRVDEQVKVLEEAYAKSLEEEVLQISESLTEQVDAYLNYVVEQWISENEIAIETGLRTELTEEFISGLKTLFAEHYIDIPEDKVSVLEGLSTRLETAETRLNEEIDRNVALTKTLNESLRTEIVNTICEGLTATESDKLRRLSENVSFNDVDEFAGKIQTLRESYFSRTVNRMETLDSTDVDTTNSGMITEQLSGPMAAYVKSIGKSLPR